MAKDAATPAHAIFDPIVARYQQNPDVDIGPMFGSEGVRVRGKVFAFVGHAGDLVVKLPEARVTELAEQRIADRMVIGARALREWAVIDVDAGAERWETLVSEAFAYLDRITP